MRVLFVVNDASTGGAQTLIESLAVEYEKLGMTSKLIVLMSPGPLSDRLERAAGGNVTYFGASKGMTNPFRLARLLSAEVRMFQPDVIHSHLLQSDLVALLSHSRGAAMISTIHTTGMTKSDPILSRLLGRVLPHLVRLRFDRSVACGEAAARYMREMGYKHPINVIDNGVRVPISFPDFIRSTSIVCLSRWHPMKDHATLFDAFSKLLGSHPELELTCAGSGVCDDNADIRILLDHFGITHRVRLIGPHQYPTQLLKLAKLSVISSSYGEALPMAGLESLAVGTPVITTDVGDCRALALTENDVVPAGNPDQLANAMKRIVELRDVEYRVLREAAHNRAAERFSIRRVAVMYTELFSLIRGEK